MNTETLKNHLIRNNNIYFGTKEVFIIEIYNIFDFVDVIFADNVDNEIFTLPVSVLSIKKSKEKHINLNKLYNFLQY